MNVAPSAERHGLIQPALHELAHDLLHAESVLEDRALERIVIDAREVGRRRDSQHVSKRGDFVERHVVALTDEGAHDIVDSAEGGPGRFVEEAFE
jgi:hypothetical protein